MALLELSQAGANLVEVTNLMAAQIEQDQEKEIVSLGQFVWGTVSERFRTKCCAVLACQAIMPWIHSFCGPHIMFMPHWNQLVLGTTENMRLGLEHIFDLVPSCVVSPLS